MKKTSIGNKIFIGMLFIAAIVAAGYVYTAPEFEREKPTIEAEKEIFWNRTKPLEVKLLDNVGLNRYTVTLSDGQKSVVLEDGALAGTAKEKILSLKYPKSKVLDKKAKHLTLDIVVTDNSMWQYLKGNTAKQTMNITVDYKRPNVNVVANSRMINQGGSALVVFQASDDNLDELYIEANGNKFIAQPYKKEGYYAALIAWDFRADSFMAKIVATDLAKNKRSTEIPFYHKNPEYKTSHIEATDKFIDGKITDLASSNPDYATIEDRLKKLKAINETMRLSNEARIHTLAKVMSKDILDTWKVTKFSPLKNGALVAHFGDHRYYYYQTKDNVVSESYHLGYDMASNAMASIKASNAGKVVFAEENGIYGNMPMIDHGLGLYTIYGHCSQILVEEGDDVRAGQTIAKTGKTGLALGDHLHFGMLVQGIEVRPREWLDQSWITKFVDNIFDQADKIIDGSDKEENE